VRTWARGALQKAVEFLREGDRFLVTAHRNVDGDGLASLLACGMLLERMGKSYEMVLHDPIPDERYSFLPGFTRVRSPRTPLPWSPGRAVVLDTPTLERLGDVASLLPGRGSVLNIDHHEDNNLFGGINLVLTEVSSTCEVLYSLFGHLGVPVEGDVALCLYTGILFDTGGFRFSNTTSRALHIAGDLVEGGVRPDQVADAIFHRRSPQAIRRLAKALSTIEFHCEGKIGLMWLDEVVPEGDGRTSEDTEGFVDMALFVDGVEVAAFLRKRGEKSFRVSLRSRGEVSVNHIAGRFGGGGHSRAAGCYVHGDLEEVRVRVLEAIKGAVCPDRRKDVPDRD